MIPGRIAGATRYLGAPANWNPETDGDCAHLAVRDVVDEGVPLMQSVWEPTPDELACLAAGGRVRLDVVGTSHPPVILYVAAPEPEGPTA